MTTEPTVVTRFAPSPTGFLHIGGARTALFNWLFSRHFGGRFRLRIEDTDRARSTQDAVDKIIDGLEWLGLTWDDEVVYQFDRAHRHAEIATRLLNEGHAYRCYATPEELDEMRREARAAGRPMRYDGRWRDRDPSEAPPGVDPVIRFKAPRDGETVIEDLVQGRVRFANSELDDLVLLMSDGSPTYMLSVVVDDHDMGITHVIRGDDHLTNAARQTQLYRAAAWDTPRFAHVPLIHGPDGAKLSKRHGALGVEAYREMGYLPEALRNYLLRLGWSHGDDEIIPTEKAIEWFTLDTVGRSPARFDFDKLENLNGHYLREAANERLLREMEAVLEHRGLRLDKMLRHRITLCLDGLKERAKTIVELVDNAGFLIADRPLVLDAKAEKLLGDDARATLARLAGELERVDDWQKDAIEKAVREFCEREGLKLGKVAQPLRAALTGTTVSPGIFDVAFALGRAECIARVHDQAQETTA